MTMAHPRNHAEVVAERVERLFQNVADSVERYHRLVGLLTDEFDAVDREAINRTLELTEND